MLVPVQGGKTLIDPTKIILAREREGSWSVYLAPWQIRDDAGHRVSHDDMTKLLTHLPMSMSDFLEADGQRLKYG